MLLELVSQLSKLPLDGQHLAAKLQHLPWPGSSCDTSRHRWEFRLGLLTIAG